MQQLLKPFPLTIKSICTLSFTKLSKLNHIKDIKKVDTSRKKLYSSMTNVALRCAVPWTVQPITVPQSNKTSREILSVDYLRYLESLVRQAPTTGQFQISIYGTVHVTKLWGYKLIFLFKLYTFLCIIMVNFKGNFVK